MEKLKEELKYNKKGITLISLIVTIVVLLILSGITIATLTGDNGILTKTQQAKNKTEQAKKQEKEGLGDMEDIIDEYTTGIKVKQVTDENAGVLEGTGTDSDPYTINSIEDLVFFSYDVTNNGNTYEGKTVKLGLSLDFSSNKSYVKPLRTDYGEYGYDGELKTLLTTGEGFKPIGTTLAKSDETIKNNSFCGYFDGNNKVIYNCYMNKNLSNSRNFNMYGFFGSYLYGEVKNLGIIEVNYNIIAENYATAVSGISGKLYDDGKLYNCHVSGNIILTVNGNVNANAAGLIDYNRGKIENCSNDISIDIKTVNDTYNNNVYCGGITLSNEFVTASVKNCFNSGNISTTLQSGQHIQIGGIVRSLSYGIVENCFNSGNIFAIINNSTVESYIGGIVADFSSDATLKNIYNRGQISIDLNGTQVYSGGIVGKCSGTISNAYNIANIINVRNRTNCLIGEIAGLISSTGIIKNAFYTKNNAYAVNSNECNAIQVSNQQLQNEVINILNSNETNWKKDTNRKNDGYPIFSWQ